MKSLYEQPLCPWGTGIKLTSIAAFDKWLVEETEYWGWLRSVGGRFSGPAGWAMQQFSMLRQAVPVPNDENLAAQNRIRLLFETAYGKNGPCFAWVSKAGQACHLIAAELSEDAAGFAYAVMCKQATRNDRRHFNEELAYSMLEDAGALGKEDGLDDVAERKGYLFIVMPMAGDKPAYRDVLDAIKRAANSCGFLAERIDEAISTERITDRILKSIRQAEFVIVDLTDDRPNVFYEAGYAFGIGKTPFYIAREGTKPSFDIQDYPILFFNSTAQLCTDLEMRLPKLRSTHPTERR